MKKHANSLKGKLLLAMPMMTDPRFYRAVIFICSHDEDGAMGIVINHVMDGMVLGDLFEQIDTPPDSKGKADLPVMTGGPIDTERGFLLHTGDYKSPETIIVNDKFSVSGTIDALKSFAEGKDPKDVIFALGYAGWSEGQLDKEIKDNAWLVVDADYELIFNTKVSEQWDRAMTRHGIDPMRLSGSAGHA